MSAPYATLEALGTIVLTIACIACDDSTEHEVSELDDRHIVFVCRQCLTTNVMVGDEQDPQSFAACTLPACKPEQLEDANGFCRHDRHEAMLASTPSFPEWSESQVNSLVTHALIGER